MRNFLVISCLLLAIGCRSGKPKYTSKIVPAGASSFSIQIDPETGFSEKEMRTALLQEAARATIDRGGVWLRINDLSVGAVKTATGKDNTVRAGVPEGETDPTNPGTASTSAGPRSDATRSGLTVTRTRDGSIRFTILPAAVEGARVFDASRLLDQLARGELPETD